MEGGTASPPRTDVFWDGVVATVVVTGDLDSSAAPALCRWLLEVASPRCERLVLDLGELVLADAGAARALDDTHKLLEAGCPVIVRRPPTGAAEARSAPAAGGPDLAYRLRTARARAVASYERTRELWQRAEYVLAENREVRQAVQDTRRGWQSRPARRELLQESEYARLVARMQNMPVIEQAKGIIMAQSACSDDEAFDLLRRASQLSNVPVRELAAQLVAKVSAPVRLV